MAQPAVPVNEDRDDLLGIPPFWAKTSVNSPFIWETWVRQFFLAVSLKDNVSPGEVLVAPTELVDEPHYPKPEAPGIDENAGDVANRTLRIAAANRRIDEYNQERRRKGPRIGHNLCYHEAEARLKSRLFFALGNEGKKRFLYSSTRVDLNKSSFIDFHKCCEDLFKGERDYTFEQVKLYNTIFIQENGSFASFYARLSAQTALCNWPIDQERAILKDLFIGRIRDVEVQRQLTRAKAILDDTLQLALENEKGLSHQSSSRSYCQITTFLRQTAVPFGSNKNRLLRSSNPGIREITVAEEAQIVPINARIKTNIATFVVTHFPSNTVGRVRPEKLLVMIVKKDHFTKVCNTTKRRVTLVQQDETRHLPIKSAILSMQTMIANRNMESWQWMSYKSTM